MDKAVNTEHRHATHHNDNHSVLTLGGEFDLASSDVLREALLAGLDACSGDRLLVDLSGVEFFDSTALGTLVVAHHHATSLGVQLILTGAPPRLQRLLDITQIDRLIQHQPDVEAALSVAATTPDDDTDDLPVAFG